MKKNILYFSIFLSIFSCSPKEILAPQEENETVFVGSFDDNLYALDAQTGTMKWAFDGKDDMYSPTVEGDKVYIHSGGRYKLYAVNISDGSKKWEFQQSCFISYSPLIDKGVLYTSIGGNFSLTSNAYALDLENGTKKWQFNTPGWFDHTTVINKELLYSIGDYGSSINVIDIFTGAVKWKYKTDGIYTSPYVFDGLLYLGAKNKVIILDSKTGIKNKEIQLDDITYLMSFISSDKMYLSDRNNNLYCYELSSGNKLWTFYYGSGLSTNLIIDNETIYFGSGNKIVALDLKNGFKKWEFETGGVIRKSPTVANGIIYFGSNDKKVYALNSNDGTKKWQFLTKDRIESTACVISKSGKVYYSGKNRLNQL